MGVVEVASRAGVSVGSLRWLGVDARICGTQRWQGTGREDGDDETGLIAE